MAKLMTKKVFVAGHRGMVGSSLVRLLESDPCIELVTCSHVELDLIRQTEVEAFFKAQAIDEVYLAAAHVGGNMQTTPAQLILFITI